MPWLYGYRLLSLFFHSFFLGLHLQHLEVPRLGVELELQLLVYAMTHGNTIFLTYWVSPGVKPASSRTLCQVRNLLSHNGNSLQCSLRKRRKAKVLEWFLLAALWSSWENSDVTWTFSICLSVLGGKKCIEGTDGFIHPKAITSGGRFREVRRA